MPSLFLSDARPDQDRLKPKAVRYEPCHENGDEQPVGYPVWSASVQRQELSDEGYDQKPCKHQCGGSVAAPPWATAIAQA